MGKISNSTILSITIFLIIIIVITASTLEMNKRHEEKLLYALDSKVKYYAKRCYLENNCEGEVTLKDLYERKYLEELVHPITKEIMNENTKITYIDNNIIINWEN